ncbi:UbiA family prenyltransferase [Haloarcula laminariae]|uniref:UbiA family prenyltransferase n=1 Tax=Haloarcula laminariae TaxID=2961577 RepID=UPI0021C7450F|nr:UbiA family prenyltransferase [Halomicroarcula laminariae]
MDGRLAGLAAHVRPVFMLPVVAISVCGALLAPSVDGWLLAGHAVAAGAALFVAHLRDGLVDGHVRGEERPLLSAATYRRATAAATVVVLLLAASLAVTANALASGSIVVLLCLALLHAPYLDRHPVSVTVDYPVGIATALAGGFATQTGTLPVETVAAAVSVASLLAGIKVGIDRLDAAFDRTIGKRTVPVIAGARGAQRVAIGSFAVTALAVLGSVGAGVFPPLAVVAAVAAAGCAATTLSLPPGTAVRVQMALSYVFVSALFLGLCGRGCAGWTVASQWSPLSAIGQVQLDLVRGGLQLVEDSPLTALL